MSRKFREVRLRTRLIFIGAIGAVLVVIGGLAASAALLPSTTGATITSDKADYAPGSTVVLTGAGWASSESVHIVVNDTIGQTWKLQSGLNGAPADPTADGSGGFTYTFDLPTNFVSDYDATATGAISGTATTTFTDSVSSTSEQCDEGSTTTKGNCNWITGSINSPSPYREGDSVAFRTFLDGLTPGQTASITIDYNFTKQSGGRDVLGYDFLTSPDATENSIGTGGAIRCGGIPGGVDLTSANCQALANNPAGIPTDPFQFSSSLTGVNAPLAGQKVSTRQTAGSIYLYGSDGSAASFSSYTKAGDPNTASSSDSLITMTFHVASSGAGCTTKNGTTTCAVEIMWGGHLAKGTTDPSGWGTGFGASSFPGSSLSMLLSQVNGASSGATNRSINPNGIIPPGNITINKVTTPVASDQQDFAYTGSGTIGNFSLDTDTSDNTLPATRTFSVLDGNYSVTENNPLPSGWSLSNLACTDPTNNTTTNNYTASIALAPGETVSCTYTNAHTLTATATTEI